MLHRPTVSNASRTCEAPGCNLQAGVLGFCGKHATQHIDAGFFRAVESGHALPEAPKCFSTEADYREYIVLFMASMVGSGAKARNQADYCRDCNPAYQERMRCQGRCAHPETVFVREDKSGGDMVGISRVDFRRWESAIIGAFGGVVKAPPSEIVAEVFSQVEAPTELKRPPGRPKKAK